MKVNRVNVEAVSDLIRVCAQEFILPRYKQLEDADIQSKTGPRDLVTRADIEAEAFLEKALPDLLPGSLVVGEEAVSRGETDLAVLQRVDAPIWVIDPVDGTHNFVHHGREFGVMVALVIDGATSFAWIYDVLADSMVVGVCGEGVWQDNSPLSVVTVEAPQSMAGFINPRFFPKAVRPHIEEAQGSFQDCCSIHCAAHEYLNILQGKGQFAVYSRLKPWDHLAGTLMVEEAGGYVRKWDGSPYTPQDLDCGLIAAASEESWQVAYEMFLKTIL